MKMDERYADIINLPHHVSSKHPQMSISDRAAQFSPFAALTGHEEAIKETARLTDERIELDEDRKYRLNEKLQMILRRNEKYPKVSVLYFVPDTKKTGGSYASYTGRIKKIDEYEKILVMTDGTKIEIDQIYEIE